MTTRSTQPGDLCDETCTTDCGHCKGAGPRPSRPERIPGRRRVLATGRDFTWGPVEREHLIGERILIIEFLRDMSRTGATSHDDHGKTMYHVEVDGRGSHSFYDFDEAVVFAIATARTGGLNGPAILARHFIAGLEVLKS